MSPAVPGAGPPGKSWDPVIFEGGKVGACVCVCEGGKVGCVYEGGRVGCVCLCDLWSQSRACGGETLAQDYLGPVPSWPLLRHVELSFITSPQSNEI